VTNFVVGLRLFFIQLIFLLGLMLVLLVILSMEEVFIRWSSPLFFYIVEGALSKRIYHLMGIANSPKDIFIPSHTSYVNEIFVFSKINKNSQRNYGIFL